MEKKTNLFKTEQILFVQFDKKKKKYVIPIR